MVNIYPNELTAAKQIVTVYDKWQKSNHRNCVLDLIGELQAGKTGSFKQAIIEIYNKHLEKGLGPINVTVLTTYSLTDLNKQLQSDMKDIEHIVDVERITILSKKIQSKDLLNEVESIKDGIVIIDEGEYGIGGSNESKTGKAGRVEILIDALIASGKSFLIMIVGATNYSLYLAHKNGSLSLPYSQVVIEPGEGYRGIKHMLESSKFHDISDLGGISVNGHVAKPVVELLDFEIENNDFGIHILRTGGRQCTFADSQKIQLDKHYINSKKHIEVHTVYSDAGYDITDRLMKLLRLGRTKHVVIIVVGAMAAGFRLNEHLKPLIRFIFETSTIHSTGVQGLPGRACGYNLSYMPTVITRREICKTYISYQNAVRGKGVFPPATTGKISTHLKSKSGFIDFIPAKYEGLFGNLDECRKYLKNIGINEKPSIASEDVKDKATKQKFQRRISEVQNLKDNKEGNYLHIGWKNDNIDEMNKYTALVYKDGTIELVSKAGDLMTIMKSKLKNNSLYGGEVI